MRKIKLTELINKFLNLHNLKPIFKSKFFKLIKTYVFLEYYILGEKGPDNSRLRANL